MKRATSGSQLSSFRAIRKCVLFLPPRARWYWAGLIPLAFLTAVLESFGAAAIFALLKIISDPTQLYTLPVLATVSALLPWPPQESQALIQFFVLVVAIFYILKSLLLVAIRYIRNRVISRSIAMLSRRMLEGYLTVPYAFHFRRNSAELIRNTTSSVDTAFQRVMASAVSIATEALIVIGIVVVLLVSASVVTLTVVVVVFALLGIMLHFTQRLFGEWGAQEEELKRATLQSLQQSLGGLKEVKVMGRERFYYQVFSKQQEALLRIQRLAETLTYAPSLLIETAFIVGMLLVILMILGQADAGQDVIPLIGLYAYAGFRVMPSVRSILLNLNRIAQGIAATDRVYQDFQAFTDYQAEELRPAGNSRIAFRHSIVLEQVSYTYDGNDTAALHGVNLTIQRGESIGIVGPTGAGKSTLVDLILGLLTPSSGRISIDGQDLAEHQRSWRRLIGYVPQGIYLYDDSLRRNIAFGLNDDDIDEEKVLAAVRLAQLEAFVARLPDGLDTRVRERGIRLSGGEKQRVAIARALYHEPQLLVFDEATSALDNQTERDVTRAIEALHGKKTLIIVAHRLSSIRSCDRLVFLRNGQVEGCGRFDKLLHKNAAFRQMVSQSEVGEAT